MLIGEQAGCGKGRFCEGGDMAENNGDSVRMMLLYQWRHGQ